MLMILFFGIAETSWMDQKIFLLKKEYFVVLIVLQHLYAFFNRQIHKDLDKRGV